MKKTTLFGMIIALVTLLFVGCKPSASPSVYDTLNQLKAIDYASVKLEVTTVMNGETINGEYRSQAKDGGYLIDYSYEKLNSFEYGDGEIIVPDQYKTTYRGTVTVKNGSVTEQSGDQAEFSIAVLTASGLNFSENNLKATDQRDGELTARVSNIKGFFGQSFSAKDMTVTVKYTKDSLTSLTIKYRSDNNAQITLKYSFTR